MAYFTPDVIGREQLPGYPPAWKGAVMSVALKTRGLTVELKRREMEIEVEQ